MSTNRIASIALSVLLLVVLAWILSLNVGGLRTQIMLGVGAVLGLLYAAYGRPPDWIVDYSGGGITEDDDPRNISPRVYLPILLGVIAVAIIALVVVVYLF